MLKRAMTVMMTSLVASAHVYAQPPNVAVDIAPLHSLVTQVMQGVGEPELLIRPEASPHEYTLRPSEAKALSESDIVFWVGHGLTPWLEKPLETLADSADKIEMADIQGLTLYDFREGATFEAHEHHDDEAHHEKPPEQAHKQADHDKEQETHHHEGHDPHVWLDPQNAKVWVSKITEVLAKADPTNAATYQENARKTLAQLDALSADIAQQAKHLSGIKFIVFHDAYQYFEQRYQLQATGAISISDASDPSPARIAEIRQKVASLGVNCVFTEPQFNAGLVHTVFEGSSISTIGTMDPIGANIPIGNTQYYALINAMMNSLKHCAQ